jgi:hypothetical protein
MLWCDRYGSAQNCKGSTRSALPAGTVDEDPNLSPVTRRQNVSFINYNFVVPITSTASISKFWFQVDEKNGSTPAVYNNGGNDYVVQQDQLLFVPMLSHQVLIDTPTVQRRGGFGPSGVNYLKAYTIVAAVCPIASRIARLISLPVLVGPRRQQFLACVYERNGCGHPELHCTIQHHR